MTNDINNDELKRFEKQAINAFFDKLKDRIAFTKELQERQRYFEALLLCSCYIDGLANHIYQKYKKSSKWKFVNILKEYGGEEVLCYVHPKELIIELEEIKEAQGILEKIRKTLEDIQGKLLTEDEIINLVKSRLFENELKYFSKQVWKGTLGAIVYKKIRCLYVHELEGPHGILFSGATFKNKPVPPISFSMLHRCLERIFDKVRALSLNSGLWFGVE